jgi:hypothetical protein
MRFAMPESYADDLSVRFNRGEHVRWYCPAGHSIIFTGDTELDKVRRERDALKQNSLRLEQRMKAAEDEVKRQARRSSVGVCPCCHRTFRQLAAHMRSKHPDQVTAQTRQRSGGLGRAAALTADRRSEIARKAAAARWNPPQLEGPSEHEEAQRVDR